MQLCIGDIKKLSEGQALYLLCLDRNVTDLVPQNDALLHRPQTFFQNASKVKYVHDHGVSGTIQYEVRQKGKLKKVNSLKFGSPQTFEFHVEHKPGEFFPFVDGQLFDKNWSEYPDDTCIGWRGPMVDMSIILKANWFIYNPKEWINLPPLHDAYINYLGVNLVSDSQTNHVKFQSTIQKKWI